MMKKDSRRGTVIIEASISLMIFMLSIYAILSVIRLAYTQERVAIAADISAKEISEYSHIIYATGIEGKFSGKDGGSSKVANFLSNDTVVDGLKKISKALNGNESTLGKLTGQAADLLGSLKHDSITGTDGNQEGNSGKVLIVVRYTIELPIFKFFNLEIKKGIDCVNFSYTEVWG